MGVSVTDEQREYVKTCMADAVALFPLNENVCKHFPLISSYFRLIFALFPS